MSRKIFVSYRWSDTSGFARQVYRELRRYTARRNVFFDTRSQSLGVDYRAQVKANVERCDLMLALIGPEWATCANEEGVPRLMEEDDLVRYEVSRALERGVPVVPVLCDIDALPEPSRLPEPLRSLQFNLVEKITHERADEDIDRIIRKLGLRGEWRRRTALRLAGAALASAVALVFLNDRVRHDSSYYFNAALLGGSPRVVSDCADCPELVEIPPGAFTMGSLERTPAYADETPPHRVAVRGFAVGRYEVTYGEWRRCVDAGGCSHQPAPKHVVLSDDTPVLDVSWTEAQNYLRWLSEKTGRRYRLPTEAELEYVIRAGSTSRYPWGEEDQFACLYANIADRAASEAFNDGDEGDWKTIDCDDGSAKPSAVGLRRPNRFGLYDTIGNAGELVADCWHDSYAGAPEDGSAWLATDGGLCDNVVIRGGSWQSRRFHSSIRFDGKLRGEVMKRGDRRNFVGFRVARDASPL